MKREIQLRIFLPMLRASDLPMLSTRRNSVPLSELRASLSSSLSSKESTMTTLSSSDSHVSLPSEEGGVMSDVAQVVAWVTVRP